MKTEIKDRWIAALRSGSYKQTQGQLRSVSEPNCYCCLGVLADLYLKDTQQDWKLQAGVDEEGSDQKRYLCRDNYLELPNATSSWAGFHNHPNPIVFYDDTAYALTELNDDVGLSFTQIADIIDEQL